MIEIKNLSKSYGDNKVIDKFSLVLPEGETSVIMGQSGCGKTTLLKVIMGLESPDGGEITGVGRVSAVFQEDRLAEEFSPCKNVVLASGCTVSEAEKILASLGLKESIHQPVSSLSGGMKRRVAIARALSAEYDLIIMDEPLKGLDEETKISVMDVIRSHCRNKTALIVTHDENEANALVTPGGKVVHPEFKLHQ